MIKKFVETNKEIRRKRIISAAIDVITEAGYKNFKLDKVVTRAGTSKSAVYSLFGNKQGLLKAICEETAFSVGEHMISQIADDLPAEAVLSNLLEGYIRRSVSKEYNAAISMIITEMKDSDEIGKYYFTVGPLRVLSKLEKFLEKKVFLGELIIDDCNIAAKQLIGSIVWFRSSVLMYTHEVDTDVEKLLEQGRLALKNFLKVYAVKQ